MYDEVDKYDWLIDVKMQNMKIIEIDKYACIHRYKKVKYVWHKNRNS